jgi:hypothetical protein
VGEDASPVREVSAHSTPYLHLPLAEQEGKGGVGAEQCDQGAVSRLKSAC